MMGNAVQVPVLESVESEKHPFHEALAPFVGLPDYCQTLVVAEDLLRRIVTRSANEGIGEADAIRGRGRAAVRWLFGLRATLNPLARDEGFLSFEPEDGEADSSFKEAERMVDVWQRQIHAKYIERLSYSERGQNPNEWIWKHRNPVRALLGGKGSGHYWPVNSERLADYCAEYVEKPWLRTALIDQILLDAMLYTATLEGLPAMRELLSKNGQIGPTLLHRVWDHPRAMVHTWKSFWRASLWQFFQFGASALVGYGAWMFRGWWFGVLVGTGFFTLIQVNRLLATWRSSQRLSHLPKLYSTMAAVCELMDKHPLSPAYLRERVSAATTEGANWPVALFPILDRATRVDPDVWSD